MKVYVGNLPFSVDEEGLKNLFSAYETEEITLIKDKFSGRSKGFGFVTFKDDEVAKKAISEMNEKDFDGRKLTVNEARPMDPDRPRRPSSGGRFGGSGGRPSGGRNFNNNRRF